MVVPFRRIPILALITIIIRTRIVDFTAITDLVHASMAEGGEAMAGMAEGGGAMAGADMAGKVTVGEGMVGEGMVVGIETEVLPHIIRLGDNYVKSLFNRF
ncbi:MAG TPA: hypothetical protein VIF37_18875 [Methylobacter sp.]|jgi:hypothetical protein